MCAVESNLIETAFFLETEFLLKTASLRSIKHHSINLHSYFRCKSSHWLLQTPIYLPKFQLFHHHQYRFVANTSPVTFLFLVSRFYIDSFVFTRKTLIHSKKSHIPNHSKSSSCASYTKQPIATMLDT